MNFRRNNKSKKKTFRPISLKIKTVNLIKRNSTLRHTLSGSIEFKDMDWKIGVNGVKSTGLLKNKVNDIDLSKLEILHTIGVGGQSEVKLVKYNNNLFALKVIYLDDRKYEYSNSRSEISLLRSINNERIVHMSQAFIKDKRICLLLEFMNCGTLQRAIEKKGGIPDNILSLITYQILKGLEYLHNKHHIIHRDIKPSNFLLNSNGWVKFTDFGVANKITNSTSSLTGTKKYKTPQCFNFEKCGYKCDIWSLGLTIAELSLGKFPFQFTNDNFIGIIRKRNFLNPNQYSKELYHFISACVIKNESNRPNASQLFNFPFIKKYNNFYDFDRRRLLSKWCEQFLIDIDNDVEMIDNEFEEYNYKNFDGNMNY